MPQPRPVADAWPSLPYEAWQETCTTLHMWTQVVGKLRLALAPMANHWWQVPLYLTCRGFGTSPIPYGGRCFEVDFDFIGQRLVIDTAEGRREEFPLRPMSVAEFYRQVMGRLHALDLDIPINTTPNEVVEAIPFEQDHRHAAYDPDYAARFWRATLQADRVFKAFRARFLGKASPVHFFWGSFDLAVTRFSGRPAPAHPGGVPNLADWVAREAYSHEVASCGFWPGNGGFGRAAFYAYAYPAPPGFAQAAVRPADAAYDPALGEFILPYDAVRLADRPAEHLLAFLQSTYEAAADLGGWDRAALERRPALR